MEYTRVAHRRDDDGILSYRVLRIGKPGKALAHEPRLGRRKSVDGEWKGARKHTARRFALCGAQIVPSAIVSPKSKADAAKCLSPPASSIVFSNVAVCRRKSVTDSKTLEESTCSGQPSWIG